MAKHRLAAALIALISVLLAAPANAAVVSITQAKVNNGGVTPGDAPGFPLTISQPGSYRLDSNLDFPSASAGKSGIEVRANDVAIDFNGFRLQGWLIGKTGVEGWEITSGSTKIFHTARIRNGLVAGFKGTGIFGGNFWVVEDMQILANGGHGVELLDQGRVHRNTISGSGAWGIACGDACFVEKNIISNSTAGGATLGAGGTILGNTIINNKGDNGIFGRELVGYGNNTLVGNNRGGTQVGGKARSLQQNACEPACP